MAAAKNLRDAERRQEFVRQKLANPHLSGTDCALLAGYGGPKKNRRSAARAACILMREPEVLEMLAGEQQQRAAKLEITADMVVERLWAIVTADPNDLTQYRRTACRFCHGVGHAYHWIDEPEWQAACDKAEKRHQAKPDNAGGYGFSAHVDPDPTCPRCNGEGTGKAFFADTRRVKGSAKLLYAGVKEGRDGTELKMHDQQAAMRDLCKLLGFFKDKVELTGKDGGPVELETKGGVSGLLAAARQAGADADRG